MTPMSNLTIRRFADADIFPVSHRECLRKWLAGCYRYLDGEYFSDSVRIGKQELVGNGNRVGISDSFDEWDRVVVAVAFTQPESGGKCARGKLLPPLLFMCCAKTCPCRSVPVPHRCRSVTVIEPISDAK